MRIWLTVPALLALVLLPAGASLANIVISEVDLANDKVELINTGGSSVDMGAWWLCNRVNGSPFYATMASATIDAANSTATSLDVAPGEILTLVVAGFLPDANGELGLYNTNSFASTSAIEDYILWGGSGIRDATAQGAGIWTDNDAIGVSGLGAGQTIQLTSGAAGNQASDYEIAASSLGSPNGSVSTGPTSWSRVKARY